MSDPIPMRLPCPECGALHLDVGEFATKVHHTHACQECGAVWRPAVVPTVGVRFLPGFKNEETTMTDDDFDPCHIGLDGAQATRMAPGPQEDIDLLRRAAEVLARRGCEATGFAVGVAADWWAYEQETLNAD